MHWLWSRKVRSGRAAIQVGCVVLGQGNTKSAKASLTIIRKNVTGDIQASCSDWSSLVGKEEETSTVLVLALGSKRTVREEKGVKR